VSVLLSYLLDRWRLGTARAEDLRALRARLEAQPPARSISQQEASLAQELRGLRIEVLELLGPVEACLTCARGHPLPHGRWPGVHCCGGRTDHLFTDDELASLRASGTRAAHLRAPQGPPAGCVFRGPTGCALDPAHRPNICVRYLCGALRDELEARGDLAAIHRATGRMLVLFTRFQEARRTRREDESFAELLAGRGR